jgi:hypothetical protein
MLGSMVGRVIAALCGFAGRGACTDAERRAAAWLHDDLRSRGHEAWVETHWVRPGWAVAVALAALLGVVGSLLSVTVPGAGVALGGVAAVVLAIEAAGRVSPGRMPGARRATQHVLTAPPQPPRPDPFADEPLGGRDEGGASDGATSPLRGPAAGGEPREAPPRVALLIAARYDAPRGGLILGDRWRALGARLGSVRAWLALACAVVAACAGARLGGVDATWLGAVQLVPTVLLLFALAAAGDVALSAWAPGANDNASGAAVALALHDELTRDPPAGLAPSLLLTGAGASGPQGLRAHLRREELDPAGAVLLEIGPCAGGAPAWRSRHPQLRAAAERAAGALGAEPRPRGPRPVRAGRIPAIRVGGLDARGIAPRAHRADDTPEHADTAAAEAALDLALGIVDALDAQLGAHSRLTTPV